MNLESWIRDVPDFPKKGIVFRDITPLLGNAEAFRFTIDAMTEIYRGKGVEVVVAVEARGFFLGAPLAYNLGAYFVPVRKAGKLPAELISAQYSLEYGFDSVEMHTDAHGHGQKVLLVDDLLATGGTMAATVELVERLGGEVVGIAFLVELTSLGGREKLKGYDITSLLQY
jgi:adenine phosphoribosyltransferase